MQRDEETPIDPLTGYPTFKHGQWTIEGELERVGAFARGTSSLSGPKRLMAGFIALLLILPFAVGVLMALQQLF